VARKKKKKGGGPVLFSKEKKKVRKKERPARVNLPPWPFNKKGEKGKRGGKGRSPHHDAAQEGEGRGRAFPILVPGGEKVGGRIQLEI